MFSAGRLSYGRYWKFVVFVTCLFVFEGVVLSICLFMWLLVCLSVCLFPDLLSVISWTFACLVSWPVVCHLLTVCLSVCLSPKLALVCSPAYLSRRLWSPSHRLFLHSFTFLSFSSLLPPPPPSFRCIFTSQYSLFLSPSLCVLSFKPSTPCISSRHAVSLSYLITCL